MARRKPNNVDLLDDSDGDNDDFLEPEELEDETSDDDDYEGPAVHEPERLIKGVPLSMIRGVKPIPKSGNEPPSVEDFIAHYRYLYDEHPEAYKFILYRRKPHVNKGGLDITGECGRLDDLDVVNEEWIAQNTRPHWGTYDLILRGPAINVHGQTSTSSIIARLNSIKIAPGAWDTDDDGIEGYGSRSAPGSAPPVRGAPVAQKPPDTTLAEKLIERGDALLADAMRKQERTNTEVINAVRAMGEKRPEPANDRIYDLLTAMMAQGPQKDSSQVATLTAQLNALRQEVTEIRREKDAALIEKERATMASISSVRQQEAEARNRLETDYQKKLADEREDRSKLREEYAEKMRDLEKQHQREVDRLREATSASLDAKVEAKTSQIDALQREVQEKREAITRLETKLTTLESEHRVLEKDLTKAQIEAKSSKKDGDFSGIESLSKGILALKAVSAELGGGGGDGGGWVGAAQAFAPTAQAAFAAVAEALRARSATGAANPAKPPSGANDAADREAWRQYQQQQQGAQATPAGAGEEPMPLGPSPQAKPTAPPAPPAAPEQPEGVVDGEMTQEQAIRFVIEETEEAADLELTLDEYYERLSLVIPIPKEQIAAMIVGVPNEEVYGFFGVSPDALSAKGQAYFEMILDQLRATVVKPS